MDRDVVQREAVVGLLGRAELRKGVGPVRRDPATRNRVARRVDVHAHFPQRAVQQVRELVQEVPLKA